MVTHNKIKDRRMALHAKSLPLYNAMKKWEKKPLCLDYEFKEENSQGLGKYSVEELSESLAKM